MVIIFYKGSYLNAEQLIDKLMSYYNVFSMHELSSKIGISQPAISKCKNNNSILAIKKKCRELGIYNEIFEDLNTNINNFQNSKNNVAQIFGGENQNNYNLDIKSKSNVTIDENILKLVDTLYSFAKTNNKIDELKTDLSSLLPKYM